MVSKRHTMKRLIFPVTEAEDKLITDASQKEMRSKCSFLRFVAVKQAEKLLSQEKNEK